MKVSLILFGAFLAMQTSIASADQRFDHYCVTTPGSSRSVLVYDDLIATYASEYSYKPFTYLKSVDVYETKVALTEKLSLETIKKAQAHKTVYANQDFPSQWEENNILTISGGRVVEATSRLMVVRDSKSGEIKFRLPFISDESKVGEIKGKNLIFDGKAVPSVSYQICGSDAD